MSNVTTSNIDTDIVEGIERDWFELTGTESGTGYEFSGEIYAITSDDRILNEDGCPLTEGDNQTIAVRNVLK